MLNRIPPQVRRAAKRLAAVGGDPWLVGGSVIDLLQDRPAKDWDIEVFRLGWDEIKACFPDSNLKEVGKQFGILKVTIEGIELDINIPRADNKVGKGHKDFQAILDPFMSVREAARRRDFTINTLAVNLISGELADEWGGKADLANGVLRATDPKLFVEDPLRALRAMQLLARKARVVDPSTMNLIRGMVDEFPHLAKERVHEEWRKLLLKAERPSVGLEFLVDSGWIKWFPELEVLRTCDQNPEWHPEGNVWIHSCGTVDSAAWVRDQGVLPEGWDEAFMFGTLLHDVGKPDTTITPEMVANDQAPKERLWTAWGHDVAGVPHGESFLRRMTDNKRLIGRTTDIIREHMQPWNLFQGGAKMPAYKRLHNRLRLDVLGWMCRCDSCGDPNGRSRIGSPDFEHETSALCWDRFSDIGPDPVKPVLMGRHLIKAGLKPGPDFTTRLDRAFEAQLDGISDIDALLQVALA